MTRPIYRFYKAYNVLGGCFRGDSTHKRDAQCLMCMEVSWFNVLITHLKPFESRRGVIK
jgi:hypothetical protein